MKSLDGLIPGGPYGLLLSRDLIFTAKITGTAREIDRFVQVANSLPRAQAIAAEWLPRVVLVDLTAGDLVAPAQLLALRRQVGFEIPFVAFGPHVDQAAFAAAASAGCDPVLPRSKFAATLPDLIRSYLPADEA